MAKKLDFASFILEENDDYIIINKPPGLATLEDRVSSVNVLGLARDYQPDAQVCHRLDKDTSGVLVIARHPEAYRSMSLQLQVREVEKVYHAVTDGLHDFRNISVNAPIRKLSNGTVCIDHRQGKDALTVVNTMNAYKNHTLVECKPRSGRMHQIRIHLVKLGAPLTGDETYGGKPFYLSSVKKKYNLKKDQEERPLIQRVALHAASLKFKKPDGSTLYVEAPYPKDFRVLIEQLKKNA